MQQRFIVVGAGAVGGLLGASLAQHGAEVAFLTRGATRERLRTVGLRVRRGDTVTVIGPLEAETDSARLAPADVVFLCVKSWQVAPLAAELGPLLRPGGVIVPLQNGLEAADTLATVVGVERVLGAVCYVIAAAEGDEIVVRGPPLRMVLGELAGGHSARVEGLANALRAAAVTVDTPADVRSQIWEKLLFVGPLGMVGAALGMTAGQFRTLPESRSLVVDAMREIATLAGAQAVRIAADAVEAALVRLDGLPADAETSMHRDLQAGRPSELEEQVGAVVRAAARTGVAAPVHSALYRLLAARARLSRGA
jgi:2-dehydropantoate 2-reductase